MENPIEAVKDWFQVTPEDYQGDVIMDMLGPNAQHNRVAMKSGHGVGKTTTEAWVAWIFLLTRPHCKVVATAPTQHQLMDILWPECAKWYTKLPEKLQFWDISSTHIKHKKFDKTWFATARTSNKTENMQGFHEDHILVICEEASGIPADIFEVIEGILSNAEEFNQEALLLLCGNPTQTAGEFYNAFHRNRELYSRYTVTGDTEKPIDKNGGQIYVSPRVSKRYRETMAAKYGDDSPVYDVRVRGIFPREADDVVIPMAWAEAAQYVKLPTFDKVGDGIHLVMDVARFGGDETVLGTFRKGHCLKMECWPKTSTSRCVDILSEAYHHRADKLKVARITVDEPGVGGGVVDSARREGLPITPYNGGGTMRTGSDPDDDVRMFSNRRSRDWWYVRRLMETKSRRIPDMAYISGVLKDNEDLVNQLASVKYDYMNEKIKVETKKEMRERLGDHASPDRADVIIMGMAPYAGVTSIIPLELVDFESSVSYGSERPQLEMDLI